MGTRLSPKSTEGAGAYYRMLIDKVVDSDRTVKLGSGLLVVSGSPTQFAQQMGVSRTLINNQSKPTEGQTPVEAFIGEHSDYIPLANGAVLLQPPERISDRDRTNDVVGKLSGLDPIGLRLVHDIAGRLIDASQDSGLRQVS